MCEIGKRYPAALEVQVQRVSIRVLHFPTRGSPRRRVTPLSPSSPCPPYPHTFDYYCPDFLAVVSRRNVFEK